MSEISYRLSIAQPHTHRFQVEIRIPPLVGPLDLAIPAWMPGAYKLVDHARNVRRVEARRLSGPSGATGQASIGPSPDRPRTQAGGPDALLVERLDMHTWRVHGGEGGAIVTYEVFADKLMIHEGQVNADHAFLNGSVAWLAVLNARHLPCRVAVDVPDGWNVVSALDAAEAGGGYWSPDFDALADAPLEAGDFALATVSAAGVRWEIAWHGDTSEQGQSRSRDGRAGRAGANDVLGRICEAIPALAREAVRLLGQAPFSRYVMFFHECQEPGYLNGLEHRTSMAMQGPLDVLSDPTAFFTMVIHEILHAWNGQRMAPLGLFRPGCDYFRPAPTTALWVVEGWTEYFASLLMLRAGLLEPSGYLAHLAETLDAFYRTPGRRCTTLEESSFITWNFGDDRWNGAINYYLKGLLTAFALDVELRVATGGRRSLDDVARELWQRYGDRQAYAPSDVERLAQELLDDAMTEPADRPVGLAGDLAGFFDLHLRSTEDPDFGAIAARLGLKLTVTERATLGLRTSGSNGELKIEGIEAYGPAENAGLQAGDVLVAIAGGTRVTESALTAAIGGSRPGETLVLTFFRNGEMQQTTVALGAVRRHRLTPLPGAQPLLEGYLGTMPEGALIGSRPL